MDVQNVMRRKTANRFMFSVQLNWVEDKRAVITSRDAKGTIKVSLAKKLGGEGTLWSSEELFLGSICSCIMETCFVFAEKNKLALTHFECDGIGQVELREGHYEFTSIDLYPRLYIMDEKDRDLATTVFEKTKKHSIVNNSILPRILYHPEILVDAHPRV